MVHLPGGSSAKVTSSHHAKHDILWRMPYGHIDFDLFEAIYTTRAMRRLKPEPVPREIILKVIEAATMSPSNSKRQPWIFLVATDATTKQFVAERHKKAWETHYLTPEKRRVLETAPRQRARVSGRQITSRTISRKHPC
jgi:hypothetical protein